jgi:hypothetical protein
VELSLEFGPNKDGTGYDIIQRAACVLNAAGEKDKARLLHQRASVRGYDFYDVLKLVKEFGFNMGG